MRPSVADRQYGYRFVHPPLHRTRRPQWGLAVTRAACAQPATTSREVVLAWARAVTREQVRAKARGARRAALQ